MRVARELIDAGRMRWVWTAIIVGVVAFWIWSYRGEHAYFHHAVSLDDVIDAIGGSLLGAATDWLLVTLVGGLAAAWHVYCVIADRARPMPLWSAGAVAICAVVLVLSQLLCYATLLVKIGWGFTAWGGLELAVNLVFLVAALKSCEIALGDRRARA